MIVHIDNMSAPTTREVAQRLYEKTAELENKRRKAVQARIPSDSNAWQQIRENYESIILQDHGFSEQHNIEYSLWQLHYKRIEDFRARFSAAVASGSSAPQIARGPSKSDRIAKIRLQFKAFLSEATGFYHDLTMKIRAKYGLPLGSFPDDSENQIALEKDAKKHAEMKKGLISCHRCLIYLGDIARYKGMYGDSESKARDFAAASSYYLQASSLWPSSGNPHHQLAILASYSGDELVTVYRCFRSLAIECPFVTAKDNLIVAFEKNRQAYAQFSGDAKPTVTEISNASMISRGRGKVEAGVVLKDVVKPDLVTSRVSDVNEIYKSFCLQFVRLNGIIFTRTSLEMFSEVLLRARSSLNDLLSSGADDKLILGKDTAENALLILRLVAILIFTAHNAKREIEGQSYAEILQRKVLLQNAFSAIFDFVGHVMKRCTELRDVSSSYMLPGIVVFMEWLASCPDIATGSELDDEYAEVKSMFWSHCIAFLNKLLSDGLVSTDDEDETCFFNMSAYEEGENESRLALWEDFELRGFLPLIPAQNILDFSRKHSSGSMKEKKARVQRIFAAGKILTKIVKVDKKSICFDLKMKKFSVGIDFHIPDDHSTLVAPKDELQYAPTEKVVDKGMLQLNGRLVEEEDEEEEILFKPTVNDNVIKTAASSPYGSLMQETHDAVGHSQLSSGYPPVPYAYNHSQGHSEFQTNMLSSIPMQVRGSVSQFHGPYQSPNWSVQQVQLANGIKGLGFTENGPRNDAGRQDVVSMSSELPTSYSHVQQIVDSSANGAIYGQISAPEYFMTSRVGTNVSSGLGVDSYVQKTTVPLPEGSRKSPISRPHRHLGPPPGFSSVPRKQGTEPMFVSTSENKLIYDYNLMDGQQVPASMSSMGLNSSHNHLPFQVNSQATDVSNMFHFPGRQVSRLQSQIRQDAQQKQIPFELIDQQRELHYQYQQQLANGRYPNQQHGIANWPDQNIV